VRDRERRSPLPPFIEPQLALLVDRVPPGDDWLHELKYDGYRILARVERGGARLMSRNRNDWTLRFQEVAQAVAALPLRSAWLDGEIAVVLRDGTTSFAALQNAGSLPTGAALAYFLFDVLHLDGRDLRALPLEERKRALRSLVGRGGEPVRYGEHVLGSGAEFFRAACGRGLEGIVSKRRDGPHRAGRGRDWVKVKCVRAQEFVIGGFTEPQGSRLGIGALLLGTHGAGASLDYAGKVGTGFTASTAQALRRRLEPLEREASPFASNPGVPRTAHWVEPRLVAQVRFTEWTRDGRLRHPSFEGLREDKEPTEVRREQAEPTTHERMPGRRRRGR